MSESDTSQTAAAEVSEEEEAPLTANLTELLALLERIERHNPNISVDDVLAAIGRRSFGPMLLIAGLITLAPLIGDIPGMPTLMALLVLLTAGQLLAGRKRFWLPGWLVRRSISREKFDKVLPYMKKPARWVDKLLRVRLPWLTGYWGSRLTALAGIAIALAMPPMEFIPFTANGAGLALALLGLGLVARDGLVLLIGFTLTVATFAIVGVNLF
ncbi:exopolysaccharide biosynthesis protein [Halomonas garicola]|uniref:exopolysaccharide biosynthesis protein n=1 Tax=Halomonas garicola TaxID=1690008 RepID=UPI00289E2430|nr:exopolysaccharide biosynthesis protein [Halomonas garicola]